MRTTGGVARAALLSLALGAVGCASARGPVEPSAAPATEGNVHLFLSNQSDRRKTVVLSVYVDGRLAVRRGMPSVTIGRRAHGFPEEVLLRLEPGPHTVRVVAEGRGASRSVDVVVGPGPLYVCASYDDGVGGPHEGPVAEPVTVEVADHPFGFC